MPSIANAGISDSHPLVATQLPSWYQIHSEHAFKSSVIPLPLGFLQYLQEDGVFLPDDSAAVPQLAELDAALLTDGDYRRDDWNEQRVLPGVAHTAATVDAGPQLSPSGPLHSGRDGLLSGSQRSLDEQHSDDHHHRHFLRSTPTSSSSGSEAMGGIRNLGWAERFPQLRSSVDSAIASLGGRVFPKLNWSCPSDAIWVSAGGSLACRNAEQVVLLLKSSDRVAHDVTLLLAAMSAGAEATAGDAGEGESESASKDLGCRVAPACSDGSCREKGLECLLPCEASSTASTQRNCGQPSSQAVAHFAAHTPQQQQQAYSRPLIGDAGVIQGEGRSDEAIPSADGCNVVRTDTGPGLRSSCRLGCGGTGTRTGRGGGVGGYGELLQPVLVLKKWYNLHPEREFRCFVRGGALVAVSQRDTSQAFPALLRTEAVTEVRQRLWRFWREKMHGRLPLTDLAYDVYVPVDVTAPVRLVDMNPMTDTTSPLLYDWVELGFGPNAVPSSETLLQQLLLPHTQRQSHGSSNELTDGSVLNGTEAAADVLGFDDSWMQEASELAALPLPSRVEDLQVRLVEDASYGGAAGTEGVGNGGLAGLVGPMLLGSRAALAMPYDMLGLADSIDKMIEVMQQKKKRQQRRRRRWQQGATGCGDKEGGASSADADGSDSATSQGKEEAITGKAQNRGGNGAAVLGLPHDGAVHVSPDSKVRLSYSSSSAGADLVTDGGGGGIGTMLAGEMAAVFGDTQDLAAVVDVAGFVGVDVQFGGCGDFNGVDAQAADMRAILGDDGLVDGARGVGGKDEL